MHSNNQLGRGVDRVTVWTGDVDWGGGDVHPPPETATTAVDTHPTGMHSCCSQ